jgi:hypothetical protein
MSLPCSQSNLDDQHLPSQGVQRCALDVRPPSAYGTGLPGEGTIQPWVASTTEQVLPS